MEIINSFPANWTDEIQMTRNEAIGWLGRANIAAMGDYVHLVWENMTDGHIGYRRSSDGGRTWEPMRMITSGNITSQQAISAEGGNVHLIYGKYCTTVETFYQNSNDNGITWNAPVQLTPDDGKRSQNQGIAVNGNVVHAVWEDWTGNMEIMYRRSIDGGSTWGPTTQLTNWATGSDSSARVAVNGSTVHVCWTRYNSPISASFEKFYRRSLDGGLTWEPEKRISKMLPGHSEGGAIAVSGSKVYVAFQDSRNGGIDEIYVNYSLDSGSTWIGDKRLSNNDGRNSGSPELGVYNDTIYVAWTDQRDDEPYIDSWDVYTNYSFDGGAVWQANNLRLTQNAGTSVHAVAVTDKYVHMALRSNRTGYTEIFYKRYPDFPADAIPPTINHTPMISTHYSQPLNITAAIADNVAISSVWLNYTDVYGMNHNVSMFGWSKKMVMVSGLGLTPYAQNGNYSYEIPAQGWPGTLSYFIWVNDTSGNTNLTSNYLVHVYDDTMPEIYHTPVASGTTGEPINITTKVTDDVAVDMVLLNFTDTLGANHNVLMSGWIGNNWSYVIPGQNPSGTVQYFIWANDTSGNANMTGEYSIQIYDNDNPISYAGLDQSVDEDEIVYFDGSGSTDNVGINWYNWTFGDGNQDFGTNVSTSHTYIIVGTYIVTLNVSDAAGNWDTDTCLVFVNNIAPIADAGGNQVAIEGTSVIFNGSGSTDTPSDELSLVYTWYFGDGDSDTGMNVSHAYDDDGSYNATLIVTDDNGFVDLDAIAVTVNNVAPTITPVANQTAQQGVLFTFKINATDVPADILTFSDNATLFDINPVTGIIQFTPMNSDVGVHFVKVTVTDDDGGISSVDFKLTVLNTNDPPSIQPIPSQTATEDMPFALQVIATDPDAGDTITYSLTANPAGMTITPLTGLISWTPTNTAVGSHAVTIRVRDVAGLYDEETVVITVANVNDSPSIITTVLPDATEDQPYLCSIQAIDVDAGQVLTYSLDSGPTFLSIDSLNGLLYGIASNNDVGIHNVVVNVTDGITYTKRTLSLTVINVNDLPTIDYIPSQTATEDVPFSVQVIGHDIDIGDTITYSLIANPSGMTIGSTTGIISWIPGNSDVGTHTVVVKVADIAGLYDTKTFSIVVANVNDAPTITTAVLPNATEASTYLYSVQAYDIDAGQALTFSLDVAPVLLAIDATSGLLYGVPGNAGVGTHRVVVNVTDGLTYTTRSFNLTVLNVNDPPTLNYIPPQAATEDIMFRLQLVGQDIDVGNTLTYSMITSPTGMTINQATGLIAWTPTNDEVGSHTVTVRVSDASGAFIERSSQITVANVNDAPAISTTTLPNATEGLMYLATVQAVDVDLGDILTFTFDSAPSFLSIDTRTGLIYGMPTNDEIGVHNIIVNVSDGTTFVTRSFNLTALNVNDLPSITSYPITMAKPGAAYTYSIAAEDTDAGDVLTYSLVAAPEGMTINNQTGRVAWTPTDAQAGQTYQVVVQVSDGHGSTAQAFSIVVDELPAEPYHPFFDDYIWVGIVLFLITMLAILLIFHSKRGQD
jgi:hypothetical protein